MYSLIENQEKYFKFTSNFFYYLELWYIMNAKIKMRQYVTFSNPRKVDTADIVCFPVAALYFYIPFLLYPIIMVEVTGRWEITGSIETTPFYLILFSDTVVELTASPCHLFKSLFPSLILSTSSSFSFTVPYRIVFAKPENLET